MATRRDLDLARRLLDEGVLSEDAVRAALDLQGRWLRAGRVATLEDALYEGGALPQGSLAALTAPSPLETQPFEGYRLERMIGVGGGSHVYAARYLANQMPVALKVLDPVHSLRPAFRQRFYAEARLHIELEHENIVAGYEVGRQGGHDFYSMDLVEGSTVLEVVERRGRLSNDEALSVTLQTAHALEYLHGRGLLHRDIKPGNVMVEASGHVRLIDLGLVGRVGELGAAGEESVTVGTVEYLSPEQARGLRDLDARADIYSLGMTLYHMVVGEVAFHGGSDYEVMAQQILSTLDAQKLKHRRIEPEIYFLIAKTTAKERDERFASARELALLIEGYLRDAPVPVDLGQEPAPPVVRPLAPHAPRPTSPGAGVVRRRRRPK